MDTPKNKQQLRQFIGLVNWYRYMWPKLSHSVALLSDLAAKNKAFNWLPSHQQAFEEVKRVVSREVMLSFLDYEQPFDLYTDASDLQSGSVLMQEKKILAFFSRKLNDAQCKYGVGEKEMLSVVDALKEFRSMIWGYPITIHADHLNWTYDKTYHNARVLRWQMLIEDFAPNIKYVKGEKNILADALSRLPFITGNCAHVVSTYHVP
jgi:hypothetical protein